MSVTIWGVGGIKKETHFCTIYLHNDDKDLIGLEVTVKKPNGEVEIGTINSDGECNFVVYEVGDYKVRWDTTEKTASVSQDDLFNNAVKDFKVMTVEIVTFADGTEEQIAAMLEAHYNGEINIADYWAVGNVRTVSISQMLNTGVSEGHAEQEVKFVIIGIEHDDLETPINGITKAAVTIHMKSCLINAGYMTNSDGDINKGKYSSSLRRKWVNNVFEKSLPTYLQNLIKPVTKKTCQAASSNYSSLASSTERCFMLSNWEVFGAAYSSYATQQDGNQYTYYKTKSNRIKNAVIWWTRSGYWISNRPRFVVCNSDGTSGDASPIANCGLAIALAM